MTREIQGQQTTVEAYYPTSEVVPHGRTVSTYSCATPRDRNDFESPIQFRIEQNPLTFIRSVSLRMPIEAEFRDYGEYCNWINARETGFRNRPDKMFSKIRTRVNQLTFDRSPELLSWCQEYCDRDDQYGLSRPDNGSMVPFVKSRYNKPVRLGLADQTSVFDITTASNSNFLGRVRRFQSDAQFTHEGDAEEGKLRFSGSVVVPLQCGPFQPYETRKKYDSGQTGSSRFVPYVRSLDVDYDFRGESTEVDRQDDTTLEAGFVKANRIGKYIFAKQSPVADATREQWGGGRYRAMERGFTADRFALMVSRYGGVLFATNENLDISTSAMAESVIEPGDRMRISLDYLDDIPESFDGTADSYGDISTQWTVRRVRSMNAAIPAPQLLRSIFRINAALAHHQDRLIPEPDDANRSLAYKHPVYWTQAEYVGGVWRGLNNYHITPPDLNAQIVPLFQKDLSAYILQGPSLDFTTEQTLLDSLLVHTGSGARLGERHPLIRLYTRIRKVDEDGFAIDPYILEDAIVGPPILGYRDQSNTVAQLKALYRNFRDLLTSTAYNSIGARLGEIITRVSETGAYMDHGSTLHQAIAVREALEHGPHQAFDTNQSIADFILLVRDEEDGYEYNLAEADNGAIIDHPNADGSNINDAPETPVTPASAGTLGDPHSSNDHVVHRGDQWHIAYQNAYAEELEAYGGNLRAAVAKLDHVIAQIATPSLTGNQYEHVLVNTTDGGQISRNTINAELNTLRGRFHLEESHFNGVFATQMRADQTTIRYLTSPTATADFKVTELQSLHDSFTRSNASSAAAHANSRAVSGGTLQRLKTLADEEAIGVTAAGAQAAIAVTALTGATAILTAWEGQNGGAHPGNTQWNDRHRQVSARSNILIGCRTLTKFREVLRDHYIQMYNDIGIWSDVIFSVLHGWRPFGITSAATVTRPASTDATTPPDEHTEHEDGGEQLSDARHIALSEDEEEHAYAHSNVALTTARHNLEDALYLEEFDTRNGTDDFEDETLFVAVGSDDTDQLIDPGTIYARYDEDTEGELPISVASYNQIDAQTTTSIQMKWTGDPQLIVETVDVPLSDTKDAYQCQVPQYEFFENPIPFRFSDYSAADKTTWQKTLSIQNVTINEGFSKLYIYGQIAPGSRNVMEWTEIKPQIEQIRIRMGNRPDISSMFTPEVLYRFFLENTMSRLTRDQWENGQCIVIMSPQQIAYGGGSDLSEGLAKVTNLDIEITFKMCRQMRSMADQWAEDSYPYQGTLDAAETERFPAYQARAYFEYENHSVVLSSTNDNAYITKNLKQYNKGWSGLVKGSTKTQGGLKAY